MNDIKDIVIGVLIFIGFVFLLGMCSQMYQYFQHRRDEKIKMCLEQVGNSMFCYQKYDPYR